MARLQQRIEKLEAAKGARRLSGVDALDESELDRIIACGIGPPHGEETEDYTRDWLLLSNGKMSCAAFARKYRRFASKATVKVLCGQSVDDDELERWMQEGTL